ncbi:MAG: transcription elongation factor GreA [Flavobacteriales bacterium]|nr:transcription elongation factor GreA [Flavobacteriales bacterium]MCZ2444144.1 transcription elongation factor GreA [Flavobacteriales bacterium]
MSKITYLTAEGYKKLQEELNQLVSVERPRISAQIAEARDKGDLSENAEYDAAKEAQGLLELKISKLQETINNSRIIKSDNLDLSKVFLLSKVKIKNLKNNAVMEYQIVSENEANLKEGKISSESPIGRALIGRKKGDKVEVKAPSGIIIFEIQNISK